MEIHKKMGMTDEQLEAYERQEREVGGQQVVVENNRLHCSQRC